MDQKFFADLIKSLPLAYAYHKVVFHNDDIAEDYIFLDANASFENMTGLDAKTIIGKKVTEVLPGIREGSFDWIAFYGQIACSGKTEEFTQYSNALRRWYKVTAFSHERGYFATVFQDITTEIENSKTLESQKEQIQSLLNDLEIIFNSTRDPISLIEYRDGNFVYLRNNAIHQKITGFSESEIIGKSPVDVHGADVGERLQAYFEKCISDRKPLQYEISYGFLGSDREWLSSITPVFENDKVKYLVVSSMDVTEIKALKRQNAELSKRMSAMFINHMAVMLSIDPESGRILDANPAAIDFYGYSKDELQNLRIQDINLLGSEDVDRQVKMALRKSRKYFVFPHRLKNGEVRMVDVYSSPITLGDSTSLFSIIFDVTEREKLKEELYRQKEMLRITLHSIGDGVVTTDMEGRITAVNAASDAITGWCEEEAVGRPFTDVFLLKNEKTNSLVENPIAKVLRSGKIVGLANHTVLINKTCQAIPIADSAAPIKDADGNILGVVMVFRDVSKEKEQQDRILYLSYHDELTGLYNRRYIEEELNKLNMPGKLPMAVVMGDVNGLKITNDIFGHEAGDILLKKVAEILTANCRARDVIARWGGDEFLIIMPNTSAKTARGIIERIQEDCAAGSHDAVQLSISMGCDVKLHTESFKRTIQSAEEKMYHQKLLEGKSYKNSIITTLLATLHERSNETEEHDIRIKKYCMAIGSELKLSSEEMNELSLLAILHDIGKVGIHQGVLQKPGPLSSVEWEEMKRHPEIGYRIAQNTPELTVVAKYILSHHERWDGNGYPRRLKEESIPLLCRIISVVDAYDAMTNDRAYRKAISKNEAMKELEVNAGTQFDPRIVKVFLNLISNHVIE